MQRLEVQSRAVRAVGYDREARELELEFHSGRVYRYSEVPESVHEWLLRVSNKGLFIARQISGRYSERSLPDRAPTDRIVPDRTMTIPPPTGGERMVAEGRAAGGRVAEGRAAGSNGAERGGAEPAPHASLEQMLEASLAALAQRDEP
jgi:hypothetical protein